MATQREAGWPQVAREFAALGRWALASYVVLSLVSHDTGCALNLGGALGVKAHNLCATRPIGSLRNLMEKVKTEIPV
jgi:hypothetical protein